MRTCASLWIFHGVIAGFNYSHLVYSILPLLLLSPWIAVSDIRNRRIPNRALLVLWILIEIVNVSRVEPGELVPHTRAFLTFAIGSFFYGATRGAIGMGDIKLFAILNLSLSNWQDSLLALTYACFIGLIWAILTRRSQIAFGPPLLMGSFLLLISR